MKSQNNIRPPCLMTKIRYENTCNLSHGRQQSGD